MRLAARLAVAMWLAAVLPIIGPAQADDMGKCPEKDEDVWLGGAQAACYGVGADWRVYLNSAAAASYLYRYDQICQAVDQAGKCDPPRTCDLDDGALGTLWSIWRKPVNAPEPAFSPYLVVCLTLGEEDEFQLITWQRVWEVMKTLEWPAAELVVQPVGGRTLINFETNFFTTTTTERLKPVRLLGRQVEIKAVPASYTWHWGDGSDAESTDDPGAEHQDGMPHEVFHVYTDAGVTVRPSLDVTYRGEYRVEGEGSQWQPIAPTLTIEGDPVPLEVVSARVQLVG